MTLICITYQNGTTNTKTIKLIMFLYYSDTLIPVYFYTSTILRYVYTNQKWVSLRTNQIRIMFCRLFRGIYVSQSIKTSEIPYRVKLSKQDQHLALKCSRHIELRSDYLEVPRMLEIETYAIYMSNNSIMICSARV